MAIAALKGEKTLAELAQQFDARQSVSCRASIYFPAGDYA